MAEIRRAAEADVPAMVGMAKLMRRESPRYRGTVFDEAKLTRLLLGLVRGQIPGGALVAELGGALVGMVGGFVYQHFFGGGLTASDFGLYVAPAHRGGSIAPRLIGAFEDLVREAGAEDLVMGVSTEVEPERTAGLYERLGYRRTGISLLKEL